MAEAFKAAHMPTDGSRDVKVVQVVQVGQEVTHEEGVVPPPKAPSQRVAQGRQLRPEMAQGQLGEERCIGGSAHQGVQHGSPRYARDMGGDRGGFNAGVLQDGGPARWSRDRRRAARAAGGPRGHAVEQAIVEQTQSLFAGLIANWCHMCRESPRFSRRIQVKYFQQILTVKINNEYRHFNFHFLLPSSLFNLSNPISSSITTNGIPLIGKTFVLPCFLLKWVTGTSIILKFSK